MKKTGVLNREFAGLIAGLGHTDCVMICDAGFPIPEGKKYVDLALCAGIPSFMDCLRVILSEAIFDEIMCAVGRLAAYQISLSIWSLSMMRSRLSPSASGWEMSKR